MSKSSVELVDHNHALFHSLPGSKHIANKSSQLNLLLLSQKISPQYILDYGAGIGTFTSLMLVGTKANIVAVEINSWCRNQFLKNITDRNRVQLYSSIPKSEYFDLVIIDDTIGLKDSLRLMRNTGCIFIEGYRNTTVAKFSLGLFILFFESYFERGVSKHSLFKSNIIEKSGSFFIISKSTPLDSFKSWRQRISLTFEVYEFYFWLRRKSYLPDFVVRIFPKRLREKFKYKRFH
jgi:hypothetical protein